MTLPVYLLDTDTCIFLLRGDSPALATRVQEVPLQQQVMSVMTFAELTYGVKASAAARRKQNQASLDCPALFLTVFSWPHKATEHCADIRLDPKKRGAQLGRFDVVDEGGLSIEQNQAAFAMPDLRGDAQHQ